MEYDSLPDGRILHPVNEAYKNKMDRIRIALVEDNPQFLAEVTALLSETPLLEVIGSYPSGEAALTGIVQTPPDVALIDIGLPGLSGVDLVRCLTERGCPTECLMLTAYDDDAHLFAALQAGAVGYIIKDEASLSELVRVIQDARSGGAPMSLGIARRVLNAFHERPRRAAAPDVAALTPREREVLEYRVQGFSTKKVAQVLHISYETVRRHQKTIYEKLHVHSMVEAIATVSGTHRAKTR
jgi:DNA-binding NarL/FixJ family response regulator